jgi:2-oxoglutarate dehydrogenase E2 component (dihydrolipoamide succinyltransferase)
MADSITQGTLASWEKKVGQFVKQDETVANIETDKVTIPVNCPEAGLLTHLFAKPGDTVQVGSDLFKIDPNAPPPKETVVEPSKQSKKADAEITVKSGKTAAEPLRAPTQSIILEKAEKEVKSAPPSRSIFVENDEITNGLTTNGTRSEHREKMTRMRNRIAERMKESQNTAASLTTFNEIDMSSLMALRSRYKDDVAKKYSVKFGFMSPFVTAAARVLGELPVVNARLDSSSQEIVYHDYVDISVAVATPKGLVTPVLRNCERMSMIQVEKAIQELGDRARDNKLALEELAGGTFTISNGGVFGSLMGTPIINVPQSAILGMHAIKERAVVIDGKVEVRPMMYVALTYDHRLIDGREAVTFLVRLRQLLEDPQRFLLDL